LGESGRVRLYPSLFEHLPNVWTELAKGSLVLLSPAAAEGFAPGAALPDELVLKNEPIAEDLAHALQSLSGCDIQKLDLIRRTLCDQVVAWHRGDGRARRLEETVGGLDALMRKPARQDLSRVGLLFLDRRRSLRDLASDRTPAPDPASRPAAKKRRLSVVVTCYEMGVLIEETVESVWSSDRVPEELLLIDDGSHGEETLQSIAKLERAAAASHLPLRVIRQVNRGLARARNAGLEAATGEFISFIDGDDRIDRRFYELAVTLLDRHPALGGVAAWAYCFGERGVTGFWNAPQPELPLLLIENGVIVPCVMRTELLKRLSGYDADQRYNYEDWELSIRLLASGRPIITIPMYLQYYRERPDSLLRTMTDVQNQIMRERLFETHRTVITRFGVEVAMLLENRLMRQIGSNGKAAPADPGPGSLLNRARSLAGLSVRRLRQRIAAPWAASSNRKKDPS
jgi:glycosyltransferase involved in cell wall biosynthesis